MFGLFSMGSKTYAEIAYNFKFNGIDGKQINLADYENKVLVVVNVASRCGFTPQYKDLENLYQSFKDKGLVVLGFPCNQFLHQEPGSNEQIEAFAKKKFHVTFPMFAKISVKGSDAAPLYRYLKQHLQERTILPLIPWNFTKFLVSRQGVVEKRYPPTTSFDVVQSDIEKLLMDARK